MNTSEIRELEILSTKARKGVIIGTYNAKSGHPGGSLSAQDIFIYLYFKEMRIDPKNPKDENRDRFVLSKGHTCPGMYSAMALRGYFDFSELENLRHVGAMLQGHPDMNDTAGVDMSTGSLGQGISAACGMAKAAKMDNKDYRVYTLLGDGECEEGQVWEAIMFAVHQKLDNLCIIVDANGLQIDGDVDKVAGVNPLDKKFEGFGCKVITIDGHNFNDIEKAFNEARKIKKVPTVIIVKTVKGKGVSYMENQASWHGKAPNEEQRDVALQELNKKLEELGGM